MKAYQAGIAKFTESNATVFGVSTDHDETNARFAKSLGLEFALLSDHTGKLRKSTASICRSITSLHGPLLLSTRTEKSSTSTADRTRSTSPGPQTLAAD